MTDNKYLYEKMPVGRAVFSLALPTVISQIIHVVYNMADTFFIGQLGDTAQVAASTLCMPLFILMTAFANLFGIGGASLISRCLGRNDREKAKRTASFCIWSAAIFALVYGLLLVFLKPVLLPLLGADETTYEYCFSYLFWAVTVGAVGSVLSACLAHLVRSEGLSVHASVGMALGGILNIILDPIFLFVFDMDVRGAAIATTISNYASLIYFIVVIYRRRKQSVITAAPRLFSLSFGIPKEVLAVGFPTFAMNFLGVVSNTMINRLMSAYSTAAISGMGIAKRIDSLTFAVSMGMTQGVLSLIGYNYSAGNYKRLNQAIRKNFLYTTILAFLTTLFLFFCAAPVSKFFIGDAETVEYGQYFLKVLCIICPLQTVSLFGSVIFQAVGKKLQPLILSFMRKGAVDIPFMLLMNNLYGLKGIPWSVPITELVACLVAAILLIPLLYRFSRAERTQSLSKKEKSTV